MELFINNKSGAPIYDQIYNQIKQQIISGALQPDEAMPSIRGLARDLRISVITTKRAYDELEKEGFLYAVPAKGFFVAPKNTELLREENLKKIEAHLTEAVRLSASCGVRTARRQRTIWCTHAEKVRGMPEESPARQWTGCARRCS